MLIFTKFQFLETKIQPLHYIVEVFITIYIFWPNCKQLLEIISPNCDRLPSLHYFCKCMLLCVVSKTSLWKRRPVLLINPMEIGSNCIWFLTPLNNENILLRFYHSIKIRHFYDNANIAQYICTSHFFSCMANHMILRVGNCLRLNIWFYWLLVASN